MIPLTERILSGFIIKDWNQTSEMPMVIGLNYIGLGYVTYSLRSGDLLSLARIYLLGKVALMTHRLDKLTEVVVKKIILIATFCALPSPITSSWVILCIYTAI